MPIQKYQVNQNVDISAVYDNVAIISVTGSLEEINISITGDNVMVARCVTHLKELLDKLTPKNKSGKNVGRC